VIRVVEGTMGRGAGVAITKGETTTAVQCSGVVVVDTDESFTCSAVGCPVGNSEDAWAMVKAHCVFVSSDLASSLTGSYASEQAA
jgi:hypothetical protein